MSSFRVLGAAVVAILMVSSGVAYGMEDSSALQATSTSNTRSAGTEGIVGTVSWSLDGEGVLSIGAGELPYVAATSAWRPYASGVKQIVFTGPGQTVLNANSASLFSGMANLKEVVGGELVDTSNVTSMNNMFSGAALLKTIDVSNWDISNVTNLSYMFNNASSLTVLDVSAWNTSKVNNVEYMFQRASSLTELDVSNWDTHNIKYMGSMFAMASSVAELDVSSWNTDNVESVEYMFYGASALTNLDVSGWNTSKVYNMAAMFYSASSLTKLDLSSWDTGKVTNMYSMFARTESLSQITLGQKTIIASDTALPNVPEDEVYTGVWQSLGEGIPTNPTGEWFGTSAELPARSAVGVEDTYVWQPLNRTVVVTPESPVMDKYIVTIPTVDGVDYVNKNNADIILGQLELKVGESITIEARPQNGYVFPAGISTVWSFDGPVKQGDSPQPIEVKRLWGATRYETNSAVVQEFRSLSEGKPIFIVSGSVYADSLSVSPAVALNEGSMILTSGAKLNTSAQADLMQIHPSVVYIVGGLKTISGSVEAELKSAYGANNVVRVGGADRYETSEMILDKFFPNETSMAYLATGVDFADALVAGPAAAHVSAPVVLVKGNSSQASPISASVIANMKAKGITEVRIAGGLRSVSGKVSSQLEREFGSESVHRIDGGDRFGTAIEINKVFSQSVSAVWMASGIVFPDALSASGPAGIIDTPIYLTRANCLDIETKQSIDAHQYEIRYIVGGQSTINDSVLKMESICK